MRDLAEQNIKEARRLCQLTDFVNKAVDAWMNAMPASPMAAAFKDFQNRAAGITKVKAD